MFKLFFCFMALFASSSSFANNRELICESLSGENDYKASTHTQITISEDGLSISRVLRTYKNYNSEQYPAVVLTESQSGWNYYYIDLDQRGSTREIYIPSNFMKNTGGNKFPAKIIMNEDCSNPYVEKLQCHFARLSIDV